MECPRCATQLPDEDVFCEACGTRLRSPAPSSCACGAPAEETDEEGFCLCCGRRRRQVEDHLETALSALCAAVSDRGLKRRRNEDRFGVRQAGGGYALVVCDGVSAARDSQIASSAVANCVCERLAGILQNGRMADPEAAMHGAIAAGETALAAHAARDGGDDPPSTTVVAALVADGYATLGWVGDSRAYWIGPEGVRQLTSDHSWVNGVVAAGEMTMEEAQKAPQAHGITRWLGADAGENAAADVTGFPIPAPGLLLLCTDGLWNYVATPEAIEQVVREGNECGADALSLARHLVSFAIAKGGHDNITAVVLRSEPPRPD